MRPRMRQRWERMSDEERNLVMQDINWQCTLPPAQTTAAETHLLLLASFTPSLYGQRLQGLTLDASTINLAVLLGDVLQACEIQPDGNMQLSLDTARAVAKLYDEAYASSRRLFGDDHPETRDNKWRAEGMREMFQEQGISLEPEAPHPA